MKKLNQKKKEKGRKEKERKERGGEPGVAAADDAEIGPLRTFQNREGVGQGGGRGVPALRVLAGPVVGVQQVHAVWGSALSGDAAGRDVWGKMKPGRRRGIRR